jgi:hypothetical protein
MAIRITCIKRDAGVHENPYMAISSFGYIDDRSGEKGMLTKEAMYNWVLRGGQVYVKDPAGEPAYLVTAVNHEGKRYVKIKSGGAGEAALLSLEECG